MAGPQKGPCGSDEDAGVRMEMKAKAFASPIKKLFCVFTAW